MPLIFKDFKLAVLQESPSPDLGIAVIIMNLPPRGDSGPDWKSILPIKGALTRVI
jgi:hypothetical protein